MHRSSWFAIGFGEGRPMTKCRMFLLLFCILHFAFCISAFAQSTPNPYTPVPPLSLGDVLLTLPTSHMPSAGAWEVRFTHRFNQPINQTSFSAEIHSLFGLDSNADVGLGLSYVPVRDLQLSIYRSNAMDDIEFGAKYNVFQQAPAIPFSAAVRVGGDWRTELNLSDRTSVFGQAIVSRKLGKRFELTLIPTFVTNAGRTVSGNTSGALFKHAFNVPIGIAWNV